MNIVFAGTPHFALPSLEAINQSDHQLLAIYTQPDRPAGRGHKVQFSPTKTWGLAHQIPIYQPIDFKDQATVDELARLEADIMVVIAYGLILPRKILDIPRFGCVNVHASLLPRWRGASPIQHALLHQDTESGVSLMQMDVGMDTGAILAMESCAIDPSETATTLHDKLAHLAPSSLLSILNAITNNQLTPTPQSNHDITYAPKIDKTDAAIDWHETANSIDSKIRAFNPWPIAYTHADEKTLRVHQAKVIKQLSDKTPGTIIAIDKEGIQVATGQYILSIELLQFAGGKILHVADWLNAQQTQLDVNMVLI